MKLAITHDSLAMAKAIFAERYRELYGPSDIPGVFAKALNALCVEEGDIPQCKEATSAFGPGTRFISKDGDELLVIGLEGGDEAVGVVNLTKNMMVRFQHMRWSSPEDIQIALDRSGAKAVE